MFKRVWFDEAKCAPGLEALRQLRKRYWGLSNLTRALPSQDGHLMSQGDELKLQ
jgi:hypothetical protein